MTLIIFKLLGVKPKAKAVAKEQPAEDMAEARKRFEAEMDAFQELMNYNQDVAYGLQTKETR